MATTAVSQITDLLKTSLGLCTPPAESPQPEKGSKPADSPKQPDIGYHPNETKWRARTARRLAEDPALPTVPLPEGFPTQLDSPLVWEAKDYTDPAQWEFELTADHLKEIDAAVQHFRGLGKPFGYISPSTFPLPTLGPILKDLSKELHSGRGFFVLGTLPVDSYSREDNILIYSGISSYVGALRGNQGQGGKDNVLSHIKDLSQTHPLEAIGSPAYTTDKQVFHTDAGDIIALFVLETSAHGGASRISSSWRIYNELAKTRPDLIKTLAGLWNFDYFGRDPPYKQVPILYYHDSKVIMQYSRRFYTGFLGLPRSAGIPPITEAQAEALDTLHFLAEKHALGLSFQKGDIQYINNFSTFHGRDAFTDTPERTRHLLRLWLHNEEFGWKLPEPLESYVKNLFSCHPDTQEFPLEPPVKERASGSDKYQ